MSNIQWGCALGAAGFVFMVFLGWRLVIVV